MFWNQIYGLTSHTCSIFKGGVRKQAVFLFLDNILLNRGFISKEEASM